MSLVTSAQKSGGDTVTAANNNAQRLDDLQMAGDYASAGGTGDALTLSLDAQIAAYATGATYKLKATASNTGAATVNINSIGAKTIKKWVAGALADLEAGDLANGLMVDLKYDGTYMQLMSPTAMEMSTASKTSLTDLGDADDQHTHQTLIPSYSVAFFVDSTSYDPFIRATGFSDDTVQKIALGIHMNGTSDYFETLGVSISDEYGYGLYDTDYDSVSRTGDNGQAVVWIGSDNWGFYDDSTAAPRIEKNDALVTISGTAPSATSAALGHDPTNSYLLVMDSTTRIRRYSGIAGTTITYVDSITLSNAVDNTVGFVFDDVNTEYLAVDTSSNLIRIFNSSGTQIDTVSYSFDDTDLRGICFIGDRLYAIISKKSVGNADALRFAFIPLNYVR